jgi:hypothetical protein
MGLDTYASLVPGEKPVVPDDAMTQFRMEDSDAYFRGNMYYHDLMEQTGVNIKKDWTPPEEVKILADYFGNMTIKQSVDLCYWERAVSFYLFFGTCVSFGLGLIGKA